MRNCPDFSLRPNVLNVYKERLRMKASQSLSTYKVAALAFGHNGEYLGQAFNAFRDGIRAGRYAGLHAEKSVIMRYGGKNIRDIIICRVGHSFLHRKIGPCLKCQKLCAKYGIRVHTIEDLLDMNLPRFGNGFRIS